MFVILEGNEGSGKTTLANYFAKKLGVEVTHRSKPKTEQERLEMYESYWNDIRNKDVAIWDRCFYSERIYGPIMRDQSYISHAQMIEYELALAAKSAFVIYCRPIPYIAYNRAQERGEDYITDYPTYELIQAAYDQLFRMTPHEIPIFEQIVGT